jgi:anaerobic selenocysteine-containing dehydrogenase
MTNRTAFRTCPLCEAGCGLEITVATQPDGSEKVERIRGDQEDVFSGGFVCPKGATLKHLHEDPDWLRQPMIRKDGRFVPVSWDEAFSTIADRLLPILEEHGRDAAAIYMGNPNVHNLAPTLYGRALITALGTRNRFSASTVDQRPKEISSGLMFGSAAMAVPDVDRTDFLLMLGANPHASNGSLCTAPNFPGRLDALQKRGGKLVVVDPRRSETAMRADEHIAIRPGTDALLLAAMTQVILAEGLATPGRLAEFSVGLDQLPDLMAPFTPEAVAPATGIPAEVIRRLTVDFCESPTAVVYGRIGTTCQEFGTASSWLVDIVNLVSGNLDTPGGAMFATGAVGQPSTQGKPGIGRGFRMARVHSRVSKVPESFGEFPVGILSEEIETPGEGQIRALITVAGNPVSSNPNSNRLNAALESLEFMVAVDPYVNETTRHADVILPPPSALQKSHYDYVLLNLAVRNVANYSPAILPLEDTQLSEAEILLRLAAVVSGHPPVTAAANRFDESIADVALQTAVKDPHCSIFERDIDELKQQLETRRGPERLLDIALRTGPFGDGFGSNPGGLNLQMLEENPHGIDLGTLQEDRIPDLLRTPDGKIQVVPEILLPELERMQQALSHERNGELQLVGRRHIRSNNSWMHNVSVLTSGRNRCTLQIHPDDAERLGVVDGADTRVISRVGELVVKAECTDVVMPGVVSIPHGFGQNEPGVQLRVASEYDGVNTNILTDENFRDEISGNIALNGVPVTVSPA